MTPIHVVYYVIFGLNVLTALAIIFFERRNVAVTWAWLMVLLFIPVGGFIVYLLIGKSMNGLKIYKIKKRQREIVNAVVDMQRQQLKAGKLQYKDPNITTYQDMIYMNLVSSYSVFTQDNEVEIYIDGMSKFKSLIEDMKKAKHHIHLEYYILRDDKLGQTILDTLTQKAKEGVEVRLMYDDVGSLGLRRSAFYPLIAAGGEVAAFFPTRVPLFNPRVNHRNHRKLAIVDGRVGYIGGFNIGDEYLGLDTRFGPWRDTHMKVEGSAVVEMQAVFMLDWNVASKHKLDVAAEYFPLDKHDGTVGLQIVSSGPTNTAEQIRNAYIKMIYAGKQTVFIQTPYFIPDESLLTALKTAALSGVDVRIMLPERPDHRLVYWASKFYLGELLDAGIRCYMYKRGFLHAKTMVIDGKIASVGTANIDIRSFKLNFEVNSLIYDTATASKLKTIFEQDLEHCDELTLEAYHNRSGYNKVAESFARLLSPIL